MATSTCKETNSETHAGIIDQIHMLYDGLSITDKRIADWFLKNGNDAMKLSISEIADDCKVGEATIFRFCKQFGVNGFREFRLLLMQELSSGLLWGIGMDRIQISTRRTALVP
jgi:DNA-binding MurR/RpiR family transcriptional regulator